MEVNPSICLCQLHGAYVSSTLSRQLTNFQISHLFSHPVNIHVHHQSVTSSVTLSTSMTSTPMTTSNIISLSIINCQSLISKVLSRYLYSPGSHQSSRFNSVSVMALKMYSVSENPVKIEKTVITFTWLITESKKALLSKSNAPSEERNILPSDNRK